MDLVGIAAALIIAQLAEMRLALRRLSRRVHRVEAEQESFRAARALPALAGALLVGVLLACAGCGLEVGRPLATAPGAHAPTPGAELVAMGHTCMWWGGIGGAVAGLVAVVAARGTGLAALALTGAECGAGLLGIGYVLAWFGGNPWAVWLAIAAAVVAAAWRWCPRLRRWAAGRAAPAVRVLTDPTRPA